MSTVTPENRERLLVFWLLISAFGIMFAVLSWMQEAKVITSVEVMGPWKGVLAILTGLVLYWLVARKMTGGPEDK